MCPGQTRSEKRRKEHGFDRKKFFEIKRLHSGGNTVSDWSVRPLEEGEKREYVEWTCSGDWTARELHGKPKINLYEENRNFM